MRRKLVLLNLVLAAVLVYAGVQIQRAWKAAKAREAAELNRKLQPLAAPPHNPLPQEPAVRPGNYVDIAGKMLLDRSRNSEVPVEAPPAPPPKPPMPALPVYYGMMALPGSAPLAIMSATPSTGHKSMQAGDTIGAFKLLSFNSQDIALEWEGEVVHKRPDELRNREGSQGKTGGSSRTDNTPTVTEAPKAAPKLTGPGETTNFGFKTCAMDDGKAEGAIVDGFRKVVHTTPFGKSCTYEPVR